MVPNRDDIGPDGGDIGPDRGDIGHLYPSTLGQFGAKSAHIKSYISLYFNTGFFALPSRRREKPTPTWPTQWLPALPSSDFCSSLRNAKIYAIVSTCKVNDVKPTHK